MESFSRENYKAFLREIKACLNKWREIPCSILEDSIALTSQFSPKWPVDLMQSQLITQQNLGEIDKLILKFMW